VETCLKNEQIKDMNKPRHQRTLATITLVVPDYDEALAWYVNVMGFSLIEDTPLSDNKRWVIVSPGKGSNLLLAKAATSEQSAAIGNQTGGRVFLFLETDDFERDYTLYGRNGVIFEENPRQEPYGTVAVFKDKFGNRWDLIEPKAQPT
jgi:catechol 2,3-dioxygenase-like lactoylglutathione lyase family enzyme